MYVYAISNNCNYDITVSNGYAKKEAAFLDMIDEMNTALRDMVGQEYSVMPGVDFSMDDKSFEANIAGCEVSFTEDGFSLSYGGDCCYGRMAEIAVA